MSFESRCATRREVLQAALGAGIGATALRRAAAQSLETAVWKAGEDGYHTYRIPAVLRSKRGALLAFCEGRKDNSRDHGDIDLLMKRSTDGGRSWSAQQVVYEEGGTEKVTIGNPCPVLETRSGAIFLPFCRDNREVLVMSSRDDGKSWTKPASITAAVSKADWTWYATGPGVGIQIQQGKHRGRLVIPCDHREKQGDGEAKMSHVFYSDDRGKSWKLGGTVAPHTDECQVAEIDGGRILINMRNYWERDGKVPEKGRMRTQSVSEDGGATWQGLRFLPELVEPVCQASLIRYDEGRFAQSPRWVFSNPADREKRIRMTLRESTDHGRTWQAGRVLHEGPSAYSCLVALPGGNAGILYERGVENPYEEIVFANIALNGPA
ncbi:MAG: sialidase family protein [Bryobacterales bacterium]|nr:sialidase family protein [Bryobacterales bacterium]